MKLFQFYRGEQICLGVHADGCWMDAAEMIRQSDTALPQTLYGWMTSEQPISVLEEQFHKLQPVLLQENDIQFAPVVSKPEKILCVGLNYRAHRAETGFIEDVVFPPLFCKYPNSLTGHGQPIHLPSGAEQFDYEAELVIVIGKQAHNVSEQAALSYVFGYTIGNDFSARDLQFQSSQWLLGKACDDFAPVGPYVVTADSVQPQELEISCTVNGVRCQHSNTANMMFTCAQLISHISQYITLMPGDLIFTGTPDGVILGKPKAKQNWLKSGDIIEISIEKLGTLRNTLK